MNENINILIVDPDEDMQDLFFRALANQKHFRCFVAHNKEEALKILSSFPIDLMLLDIGIVFQSYFAVLQEFLSNFPRTTILVNGSIHQMRHLKDAVSAGAHGYFVKPISLYSLRKIVSSFIRTSNLSPRSYTDVTS